MERRLKVLISAYACEPGKGSEPEVGWQWATQMARYHDVTVLTRANNEAAIDAELKKHSHDWAPRFAYFDLKPAFQRFKKRFGMHNAYYSLWQRAASRVIADLVKRERFDLLHHVTYAGARYPTAVLRHGVPSIFGPVGGLESMTPGFLPWRHPGMLAEELARNAGNLWQEWGPSLKRKLTSATVVVASTPETQEAFARLGVESRLLPAIGLNCGEFAEREGKEKEAGHPLRLLFAGRLLYWKGVDLALRALAQSKTEATLTLVGDGKYLPALRDLARELHLEKQVEFCGQKTRGEVLRIYRDHDAFLYPSLHDSGGFTLIEAMASGLPPICLDCGGPGLAVTSESGLKIGLGRRSHVIGKLAEAIDQYAADPGLRVRHGQQARERIRAEYDWSKKAEKMDLWYREAVGTKDK